MGLIRRRTQHQHSQVWRPKLEVMLNCVDFVAHHGRMSHPEINQTAHTSLEPELERQDAQMQCLNNALPTSTPQSL